MRRAEYQSRMDLDTHGQQQLGMESLVQGPSHTHTHTVVVGALFVSVFLSVISPSAAAVATHRRASGCNETTENGNLFLAKKELKKTQGFIRLVSPSSPSSPSSSSKRIKTHKRKKTRAHNNNNNNNLHQTE